MDLNQKVNHDKSLDEVLIAMDVVDTLRHRDKALLKELDRTGRKADLVMRLREIYAAQGIDVPDHVIEQGVKALEQQRFRYVPAKGGLGVWLAKIYVSRSRWWKPVTGGIAALALGLGVYQFGYAGPEKARAAALAVALSETLPREITSARDEVLSISQSETVDRLAETFYQDGLSAARAGDALQARAALSNLSQLYNDVAVSYDVRVVYGPNESRSGVFRIDEDAPGVTNFYLIVEAVRPSGEVVIVPITSEEDQKSARVSRWGQRVSEADFERVAADKQDDLIIQDAIIGRKASGQLAPSYSVETPGGAILEWQDEQ